MFSYFIIFPFAMTSMYNDGYDLLLIFEVTWQNYLIFLIYEKPKFYPEI